ncbi:alcohol dehydrogenase [Rhodococcus sp. SC4]|nr:alcohol dehydrogenase [Rhodococcus sp. SC4]
MRAWQITSLGQPEQALEVVELPDRAPAVGEVAVRVDAAALGFPDLLLCRGDYHDKPDLPFTIGAEAAGVVAAVGPGVKGAAVGDRVIVTSGETVGGTLADRLVVPEDRILPVPAGMPSEQAAAFFVAYQTSYMALFRRAGLRRGETLVVHGASGGIGSAAVQLGRAAGARVIAVAGGPVKAEVCERLGADEVIDHTVTDFVAAVKELTGGRGADVIYDSVGGDVFDRSRRCIAVEGRLLVVGFAGGTIPQLPVNHALLKNYSVVGFRTRPFRDDPAYVREVHDALSEFHSRGLVTPLVQTVDFGDVPKAVHELGERTVVGRLVVQVSQS